MPEKIVRALLWILPGLLFLVVLMLVISGIDRRSRTDRSGKNRSKRTRS